MEDDTVRYRSIITIEVEVTSENFMREFNNNLVRKIDGEFDDRTIGAKDQITSYEIIKMETERIPLRKTPGNL